MSSSDFFTGEIKSFGFTFAPRGWALCEGQLLAVSQNEALFSLIGTIYGGNGRTTFGLPDLRGRISLHDGNGPGLSDYRLGQKDGQTTHTLITQELPSHRHTAAGSSTEANAVSPAGTVPATTATPIYSTSVGAPMANIIGQTGGNQNHDNMEPYTVISWCICLFGVYPSRN